MLRNEKDDLQLSDGNLSAKMNKLESMVTELEMEKATTKEKEKQYQMQVAALEEQKYSLTASLKDVMEQKTNIQPLKEHVLIQIKRIHQIQIQIEDERCKILQIDTKLEEIIDTASYFLDRSQDILEILNGRMRPNGKKP